MFVLKKHLYLDTSKAHPLFSILPRAHLSCAGKGLCHLAVPPSIAGSDEVSDTTALQEGGRGHRALAEELGEGDHLHEAQSDHRCLGVVAKAQPIAEASPHGHYILWKMEVTDEKGSPPSGPSWSPHHLPHTASISHDMPTESVKSSGWLRDYFNLMVFPLAVLFSSLGVCFLAPQLCSILHP